MSNKKTIFIGLGKPGIQILNTFFTSFPNLRDSLYVFESNEKDLSLYHGLNKFLLKEEDKVELYEEQDISLSLQDSRVVLFLTSGKISSISSRIIQNLSSKDLKNTIEVVLITPENDSMNQDKFSRIKAYFNVICGLTKNSIIDNCYIFNNNNLLKLNQNMKGVSFKNIWNIPNYYIAAMLNYCLFGFDSGSQIYSTHNSKEQNEMFHTFSVVDLKRKKEIKLGNLSNEETRRFFIDAPARVFLEVKEFSTENLSEGLTTCQQGASLPFTFDIFEKPESENETNYTIQQLEEKVFVGCKISTTKIQQIV